MAIPNLTQQASNSDLSGAGLRLFFNLAELWSLSKAEQLILLGVSSRTTLNNWATKAKSNTAVSVSRDTLERLSLIAGIRKAVELLYPNDIANLIMKVPNKFFGDRTILDVMLQGNVGDLYDVRRYLDANRGAHFG